MADSPFIKQVRSDGGFTLIEIIIVMVIVAITATIVVPRMTNVFGNRRTNFIILTSIIAKTFDNAFIRNQTDLLVIHCYEPDLDYESKTEYKDRGEKEIFSRRNGISVITMTDGTIQESSNPVLQHKSFPDSFKIEEVLLPNGERMNRGNVLVPFYPNGEAGNAIIHLLVNDEEKWSIIISKLRKEAEIKNEYISFEDLQ